MEEKPMEDTTNQQATPAPVDIVAVNENIERAFDEFLAESPRPTSVTEWAAGLGLPTKALRELQRHHYVLWLRCPKTARKPATIGGLAEYLGVSTVTLWKWRDESDV